MTANVDGREEARNSGGSQCFSRAAGAGFFNRTWTVCQPAFIAFPAPCHKRISSAIWQLAIRVDEAPYCLSPLFQGSALRVN